MKKLAKLFAIALASVTIAAGSLSAVEIKKNSLSNPRRRRWRLGRYSTWYRRSPD